MAKVQLDEDLWWDLVSYHLTGERDPERELRIRAGLDRKLQAMARRTLYTQSKTAEDPRVRELARQAYLDAAGIQEDFRQ